MKKNLISFVPRTLVQQGAYARSEVRVYSEERQRSYGGCWNSGAGVLNAAWSGAARLWLWNSDVDRGRSDRCMCYCCEQVNHAVR